MIFPAYNAGLRRSSWTPADIATRFWYRADDYVDTGGLISQINDRSGNLRHLTQGTASARPTPVTRAGQAAMSFDGGDRLNATFGTTLTQPNTTYVVWESSSTGVLRVIVDGNSSLRQFLYHNSSGVMRAGATTELVGGTAASGQIYASCASFNNTSSSWFDRSNFVTAAASGTMSTGTLDGLSIGANNAGAQWWNGFVWEVIGVAGVASASDRKLVGDYFTARYTGLTVTT